MIGAGFVDQAAGKIILGPPAGDDEKRSAARFAAGRAHDADDLRRLLDILGIDLSGRVPASEPPRTGRSAGHARSTVGKARP